MLYKDQDLSEDNAKAVMNPLTWRVLRKDVVNDGSKMRIYDTAAMRSFRFERSPHCCKMLYKKRIMIIVDDQK